MGVVKARIWLVLGLLLVAGTTFRLRLVRDHHGPAGDGLQYWTLSQELLRAGRLAFGPPPAPLTFTRLPGYPLFLAHVAVLRHPADLETHLVRATRANALLGVGTGVLLFRGTERACRGRPRRPATRSSCPRPRCGGGRRSAPPRSSRRAAGAAP